RPVDRAVLKAALEGVSGGDKGLWIDAVVLGCTHFPLLREELEDVATFELGWSPDVRFVDGAAGIARRIAHLLEGQSFARTGPNRFVVTGPLAGADGLEATLAARGFGPVEAF
ncbi:MAG: glutamate racemase, partial [Sphingomonadales bacterium]|nr:glutamate racemase [Sphingomonadales bacterium]